MGVRVMTGVIGSPPDKTAGGPCTWASAAATGHGKPFVGEPVVQIRPQYFRNATAKVRDHGDAGVLEGLEESGGNSAAKEDIDFPWPGGPDRAAAGREVARAAARGNAAQPREECAPATSNTGETRPSHTGMATIRSGGGGKGVDFREWPATGSGPVECRGHGAFRVIIESRPVEETGAERSEGEAGGSCGDRGCGARPIQGQGGQRDLCQPGVSAHQRQEQSEAQREIPPFPPEGGPGPAGLGGKGTLVGANSIGSLSARRVPDIRGARKCT